MNNDLTFFTNEPENSLYERFNKILKKNTQFFDVLVGYFRASGFYLLQDSLDNVEKTRILIGINTDKQVLEMFQDSQGEIKEMNLSNIEAINQYKQVLQNEFEKSEDIEEVESGVNKFIKMLKDGRLELRIYTKQQIHAKIYIMKDYEDSPDYGRVITGSSNFSQNGLINNLEFNVELKNSSDVKFAQEKFDDLWRESIEINQACIDTIENKTWIKSDITPYEMYVKFLYEYFKEEINDDQLDNNDKFKVYPDGFKPLQYQKDAVIQAKRMLEKHNGIFISDVVGLGKTYICALLAQELPGRKLILCPPVLKEYWENVMYSFQIPARVESVGKLDKIVEEGHEQYSYVFVDESHKFRNSETTQYTNLSTICYGKKVILISATPQNNYNSDIANQLYLFQMRKKSTLVNVRNLENFFATLKKKETICKKELTLLDKDSEEYKVAYSNYKKIVKENSNEIRDKILREIMIRRTRSEIQKTYAEDLKKQKLTFPKVSDPKRLIYEFDQETEKVFEATLSNIKEITYSRYKPLTYIKDSKLTSMQSSLLTGQRNMGGFMKSILIKRLESSKFAFEMTLTRFIESYQQFIDMYNNGIVWVSRKLNVQDLLDNDDIDKLNEGVEKEEAFKFNSTDFLPEFIIDLKKDLNILKSLRSMWLDIKQDNKLEYFIDELKTETNLKNNKLIIFTESKETAEYLSKEIQNGLNENVIVFSGSMPDSIRNNIRANFDPMYNESSQRDDYRILVTTDVLAEGMNLHRSNIIINYDLPWNPARIMQRVGRINRVGTKHSEIFVYNFFPTSKSDNYISQEQNIVTKMQMFHDILGEDAKYLTEDEEISTYELFKRMTTKIEDEDEEINSELSYLKIIRDIRDNDTELFNKVKNYPKKIKIGRKSKEIKGLITFFRRGYLKRFYLTDGEETEEITFEKAIEYVKATKSDRALKIKEDFYKLLKENKCKFELAEQEEQFINVNTVSSRKGSSNAKNIIKILKLCLKIEKFTDEEYEKINKIIDLLEDGVLSPKLLKEANKLTKKVEGVNDVIKFFKKLEAMIPDTFYSENKIVDEVKQNNKVKEIILSEYFM